MNKILFILSAVFFVSCTQVTNDKNLNMENQIKPELNHYGDRKQGSVVDTIIVHFTAVSFEETIRLFTNHPYVVSAHYIIDENGKVYPHVEEHLKAHHAGKSSWHDREALNDTSIGIEIVNDGKSAFKDIQMEALLQLIFDIKKRHAIKGELILGHSDIAVGRKVDPGIFFPWKKLAEHGFGMYLTDAEEQENISLDLLVSPVSQLKAIGYRCMEDYQEQDMIKAFQMHFDPQFVTGEFLPHQIKMLNKLYRKYRKEYL